MIQKKLFNHIIDILMVSPFIHFGVKDIINVDGAINPQHNC